MTAIHWILYMHFNDFSFIIKNLLPNPPRPLRRIDFFYIARLPTVAPSTSYQYRRPPFGSSLQRSNFFSLCARVLTDLNPDAGD
jgi:hypothetical protein